MKQHLAIVAIMLLAASLQLTNKKSRYIFYASPSPFKKISPVKIDLPMKVKMKQESSRKTKKVNKNHHVVVLYDGINNSVFTSQVLTPIIQELDRNPQHKTTIVSYERKSPHNDQIQQLELTHPRLVIMIRKRNPFFGTISLYGAINAFKKIVQTVHPDHITARGPLAGYIALHSWSGPCTIQARGLCAEEFRYSISTQPRSTLQNILDAIRYRQFYSLEKAVYTSKLQSNHTIEVVSEALKTYLIETFKSNPQQITLAHKDIPATIKPAQRTIWRLEIRTQLHISDDMHVFCYCGSAKPWQCGREIVDYFKQKLTENSTSFLLILTNDVSSFTHYCTQAKVPPEHYAICSIQPHEVYRYLSAGDSGLLFRTPDIVNWVSRPTKLLEYQSVGLDIIHNNTIGMLAE